MTPFADFTLVVLVGVGATAVMDIWLILLKRLGVPTLDFAVLGRWVGYLARGRFAHEAIAKSPALPAERALGWLSHYAVGIAFAGLLVGIEGIEWVRQPTLVPAVVVGVA